MAIVLLTALYSNLSSPLKVVNQMYLPSYATFRHILLLSPSFLLIRVILFFKFSWQENSTFKLILRPREDSNVLSYVNFIDVCVARPFRMLYCGGERWRLGLRIDERRGRAQCNDQGSERARGESHLGDLLKAVKEIVAVRIIHARGQTAKLV